MSTKRIDALRTVAVVLLTGLATAAVSTAVLAHHAFSAEFDASQPVVMFALEWCEFCWSVRKMFAKCNIPYRSVDLDSVEYQENNRGGEIRAALSARTSFETIPQIFVGGKFLGGCTDIFDAYNEGRFQELLEGGGVQFDETIDLDPYSLLPTWLHPR